jgi:hypothetical protein
MGGYGPLGRNDPSGPHTVGTAQTLLVWDRRGACTQPAAVTAPDPPLEL